MELKGSDQIGSTTGVTLVICCHNSAARLPETLRHLAAQQVPAGIPWEVLLVDNASSDETVAVAQSCWPSPPPAPLRIVREPKLGVGNARLRSFLEARGEIISFIDDDNWVGPDWVSKVVSFFAAHPQVDAVGGPSRAVFESPPPAWFSQVSVYFAVGEQYPQRGDITDRPGALLWGAGMSFRRVKAVELLDKGFQLLLGGGDELEIRTGEDSEIGFGLRAGGARFFYEPSLAIEHFMPSERLTWATARKLMHSMGEASVILELYGAALATPSHDSRPGWKSSWLFVYLKTLRDGGRIFLSHPLSCRGEIEGSLPALSIELVKGRLMTLGILRGRFERTKQRIRQAGWARSRPQWPQSGARR